MTKAVLAGAHKLGHLVYMSFTLSAVFRNTFRNKNIPVIRPSHVPASGRNCGFFFVIVWQTGQLRKMNTMGKDRFRKSRLDLFAIIHHNILKFFGNSSTNEDFCSYTLVSANVCFAALANIFLISYFKSDWYLRLIKRFDDD